MTQKIFLGAFLLAVMFSCNKKKGDQNPNNPTSDTTNILNANTHIIDTSAIQNISDNSVILLSAKINFIPKAGDILLANPTISNPYGLLRKVLSVTGTTDQFTCNTEQSNLNDAFDQLYLNTTYTNSFSSIKTGRVSGDGSSLTFKFSSDSSIADGLKFSGEIKLNISSVTIDYEKKQGSLTPQNVLIKADMNSEGSNIEITNTNNSSIQLGPKVLTEWDDLPIIYVPIPVPVPPLGIVVVDVPFAQHLEFVTLPLNISGKAKWATLPAFSATVGVEYQNSTWSNLSTFKTTGSATPLSKGDFDPSLSFEGSVDIITPEYDITPYKVDALKAFFKIPNELDLTLQTVQPNYSLKYKLDLTGGVKQEFYTGVKQEYSITGNIYSQTLLEGNWNTSLPSLETNNISSITANTSISGGNVTDSGGAAVTSKGVCWSTSENPTIADSKTSDGTGTGTFISNITGLTNNQTYHVRAYAINSAGTAYGNDVSFTAATISLVGSTYSLVSYRFQSVPGEVNDNITDCTGLPPYWGYVGANTLTFGDSTYTFSAYDSSGLAYVDGPFKYIIGTYNPDSLFVNPGSQYNCTNSYGHQYPEGWGEKLPPGYNLEFDGPEIDDAPTRLSLDLHQIYSVAHGDNVFIKH